MKRSMKRKAFTIIEMTIVIAVIAILASVMIPAVSSMIEKAYVSKDTQFAASLNVQLALWEVDNGEIKSESDLQKAINYFYNDAQPGYYETKLAPESGKYGYHYWYDVNNGQVVLNTYEGISKTNGRAAVAPSTFEAGNPRTITTANGTYLLLDRDGSVLSQHIAMLDQCNKQTYTTVMTALSSATTIEENYIEEDHDLASAIFANLQKIAIVNSNGTFAHGGTVESIFIPMSTGKLSSLLTEFNGTADFSSITSIVLPDGVAVGDSALVRDFMADNSTWNKIGATTIFVNATEEELADLFDADSTNCVIELPTGDRYIVDGATIKKLTESGPENVGTADYTTAVDSVTFSLNASFEQGNVKAKLVGGVLYIAYDYAGDLKLSAECLDENGNSFNAAVTWSTNAVSTGVSIADGMLTVPTNAEDFTVTATVQGKPFTVTVQNVGIKDFKLGTIGGKPVRTYNGAGYNYSAFYQLVLGSTRTFDVTFDITAENTYVDVDKTVTGPTGNSEWSYANNAFTIGENVKNLRIEDVVFTCGGKTAECDLNFVHGTNSPFAANAETSVSNYKGADGNALVYHIGNKGVSLTLGHLFTYATGMSYADIDDQAITYSFSVNNWSSLPIRVTENWQNQTVDLSKASGTFTVNLSVGETDGKSASVQVKLISGAYNITDAESWRAVPNGNSIVLLNSIDLIESTYTSVGDKSEGWFTDDKCTGETSACAYSINLGSASIYGNMKTINLPTYLIKSQKTNSYFIHVGGGTISDLIIAGPDYGSNCATTRYDTAAKNGYWVTGVDISSGTIQNSYISGFRNAVYVTGSSATIKNSTINGGSFANIYCHVNNTLTLTNVNTIQSGSNKGAGIFVDGGKTTFVVTNLKQYNFYTKDDLDAVTELLTGYDLSLDYEAEFSALSTSNGYHVGIIVWNEPECKHTFGGIRGIKVTSHTWAAESATIASCPYSVVGDYEHYKTSSSSTKIVNLCVGRSLKAYGVTGYPTDTNDGSIATFLADPIRQVSN